MRTVARGATTDGRAPEIQRLREEAFRRGAEVTHLRDRGLTLLLERIEGDIDLAATAITMTPRPKWVEHLIGPT